MAESSQRGRTGSELERFVAGLVDAGLATAAVGLVAEARGELALAAAGVRTPGASEAVELDDLFDAASLTKPFLATLALRLDSSGLLPLDLPIGELLAEARPELARRPLEDLLRHRSGLAPWYPLWAALPAAGANGNGRRAPEEVAARRSAQPARTPERSPRAERARGWERASGSHRRRPLERGHATGHPSSQEGVAGRLVEWLAREAPLGAAPGTYSDLGYLLWSALAARAAGHPLEALLRRQVLAPLGLGAADVVGAPAAGERVVACVLDDARERELAAGLGFDFEADATSGGTSWRGLPQDRNARFLGGLPGHAGLFVTAGALATLGREWLAPGELLERRAVRRALAGPRGPFALGWARRSRDGSSGLALSPAAFGHAGFTGGSLWVDSERGRVAVLLAHRVSTAADFNPHRRAFHRLALALSG